MALNVFSENSGLTKNLILIKEIIPIENKGVLVYRIFNLNPKGYIIISADDNSEPVLGYGLDSNFSFDDAPPALLFLLDMYKSEMLGIIKNELKADDAITGKWEKYTSSEYAALKSHTSGTYLLETTWGQGSPYYQYCPLDPNTGDTCVVGCTAVALGQILHYWGCRVFPDGTRTYIPRNFTNSLTVNFYDQNYDWDAMNHTSGDTDNAELLYHCGVAIRVNYTDSTTGGYSSNVEYAMENNFGFETDGLKWSNNYTPSVWLNMLKSDIDAGRPIYYRGTDTTLISGGGHAWIIDGYNANNEFHCNWGWNGQYINNWYSLTALNPSYHKFDYDLGAIIGAEPVLDACTGLSGATLVCSSNESYSVTIPSSASVNWSKSANLSQVGGNTGTTYIVIAGTPGPGSVTVSIKNSQGETFLTRSKDVWVSSPAFSGLIEGDISIPLGSTKQYLVNSSDIQQQHLTVYDWDVTSNLQMVSSHYYQQDVYVKGLTLGRGSVYFISSNTCGSSQSSLPVRVTNFLLLAITPNPASGETTLSIEWASKEKTFDETVEWELEVYGQGQLLKEKKTSLKGRSTKIQTAGWKEGVYMVRVKYKDEILTGKLVVKR